jgi:hypothetical protein
MAPDFPLDVPVIRLVAPLQIVILVSDPFQRVGGSAKILAVPAADAAV